MILVIFGAVATVIALVFDLQPVAAYEYPWCAVIGSTKVPCIGTPIQLDRTMPAECVGGQSRLLQFEPYFFSYGVATNQRNRKHRARSQ